jgi:hypothetical protein
LVACLDSRFRRWLNRCRDSCKPGELPGCFAHVAVTAHPQAFQRITAVLEQVPSVGHLYSLWCTSPYRLGIGTGTVAGNDAHLALGCQPACQCRGIAIPKQVNRPVAVQMDHDRTVPMSTSERPIINANLLRRR